MRMLLYEEAQTYLCTNVLYSCTKGTQTNKTKSHKDPILLAQIHHWSKGRGVCMTTFQAGVTVTRNGEQI